MYVMLTFLEVNGIPIDATNKDVEDIAMSVAAGTSRYEELLDWVNAHENP